MKSILMTAAALGLALSSSAGSDWTEAAWTYLMTKAYSPKTHLLYDYRVGDADDAHVKCLPSPEDIRQQFPVPTGWGTGMEDSVLNGSPLLMAGMLRFDRTGRPEDLATVREILAGLFLCGEIGKTPGFLARSVSPADGASYYLNSSRDQYTLYIYALWRYFQWPQATEAERDRIRKILVNIAAFAERTVTPENDFSLTRDDGGPAIVCKMWTATPGVDQCPTAKRADYGRIDPSEIQRLVEIYAAAFAVSGDRHWREKELEIADAAMEMGFGRVEPSIHGFVLFQWQVSLRLLHDCETDPVRKATYLKLMNRVCDISGTCLARSRAACEKVGFDFSASGDDWRERKFVYLGARAWTDGVPAPIGGYRYLQPQFADPFLGVHMALREAAEPVLVMLLCPGRDIPADRWELMDRVYRSIDFARFHGVAGPCHALFAEELLRRDGKRTDRSDWRRQLPRPVFDEKPELIELYDKAWEIAHTRIDTIPGLPAPRYMDEAHQSDRIWIWDTCFMVHFCKYCPQEFPGIESLENFYDVMLAEDRRPLPKVRGNRWCGENEGKMLDFFIHHPDNPPLFAWTEYVYALQTGDRARLEKIYGEKRWLQRWYDLFENFDPAASQPHGSWAKVMAKRTPDGFRWGGCSSGMDNTPRGRPGAKAECAFFRCPNNPDLLWVDALAQQGLSALSLSRIAELLGRTDEAKEWKAKYEAVKAKVNALYWDEADGFYYDILAGDRSKCKVPTMASYWPLLAEMPDAGRSSRMIEKLADPAWFGGFVPTPSLARHDADFVPDGGYWRGSIWLPTTYMAVKAADANGRPDVARTVARGIVDHMYGTFAAVEPHTIWECYSPTEQKPACSARTRKFVKTDFCGWSALGPISLFIEDVIGVKQANAFENTLVCDFDRHPKGRVGVENYRFGTVVCSVIATEREIVVTSNAGFTLIADGRSWSVREGRNVFARSRTGVVYGARDITVDERAVTLAPDGERLAVPDIAESGAWRMKNYEDKLKFEFDRTVDGLKAVCISGPTSTCDNAWLLRSPRISLPHGGEFILSLKRTSRQFFVAQAPRDRYREWVSAIWWYDATGKELEPTPLKIDSYPGSALSQRFFKGTVPENAVAFEIGFGNNNPCVLKPGDSLSFADVTFALVSADDRRRCRRCGSFESEVRRGGRVSWQAETPKGTSVAFQVAAGDDPVAALGAPFVGPDGTGDTFYDKPFGVKRPFLRWKAFLRSEDGRVSPSLRGVRVGDCLECDWSLRGDSLKPRVTFLGETPTTNVFAEVKLSVSDTDSFYLPETFRAFVDGKDVTTDFVRSGETYVLRPRAVPWTTGLHEVRVTAGDCHGNLGDVKTYFFIGEPVKAPRVTLRDDGMTLIDGKPFFPLGLYGLRKHVRNGNDLDRAVRECKEAGFNMVQSYKRATMKEFLAAAEKYGLKTFYETRLPDARLVDWVRHSPAVIAWYIGDDTFWHETPEELMGYDAAVKAVAPLRLTTQASGAWAETPSPRYADYVEGTDTFLPEIYPVQGPAGSELHRRCVATVIRDMKAVCRAQRQHGGNVPRSCWPIIQDFRGWSTSWSEFPTREELYGMTFAAICNGAQGLTWYTYEPGERDRQFDRYGENQGCASTPERWAVMRELVLRLNALLPVLEARTPVQPPPPEVLSGPRCDLLGNRSVSSLCKRTGNEVYVFAVNSTDEPVTARLQVPYAASCGEALWESRSVAARDGALTETFGPFGVHVCRFAVR